MHLQSDSVPDRGRLELLVFSFYLHELSPPADHLTELHACCELLKGQGRGDPAFKKYRSYGLLWEPVCSSKCKSHVLSESQQCSERSQSALCEGPRLRVSLSWEGCDGKTKRQHETEMEAVAQIQRALKAEQVYVGSSVQSYLTGDRITNGRKSPSRKYSWRENARMKFLAIFPSYVYKDRESC